MSRTVVLIRHSEVTIDRSQDRAWHLSANGRARCHKLAAELVPYRLTYLVSSEEPKATETAALLAQNLAIPYTTAPNLQEHERSRVPYFDSRADFEEHIRLLFNAPKTLVFGQETGMEALIRFETAVYTVLHQYPEDNIGIVSHGTVMALFLSEYNRKYQPFSLWRSLTMPCAFAVAWPQRKITAVHLLS